MPSARRRTSRSWSVSMQESNMARRKSMEHLHDPYLSLTSRIKSISLTVPAPYDQHLTRGGISNILLQVGTQTKCSCKIRCWVKQEQKLILSAACCWTNNLHHNIQEKFYVHFGQSIACNLGCPGVFFQFPQNWIFLSFKILKMISNTFQYQPSSAGGTRSPPARLHRLQHLTARLIQNGWRGLKIG